MKTIGLIGGMSWESSALYYNLLNTAVRKRLGGLHSARCIVYSVDFAKVDEMQVRGEWDAAGEVVADCAQALVRAGADFIVLSSNTMHIAAEQIEQSVGVPFLHIADAAAVAVKKQGLSKVGLLGTAFTMEKDFYRQRLNSHGLEMLIPPAQDRRTIHRVIYDELCQGQISDVSRESFRAIIRSLVAGGAEGIVSGCTEIELLIGEDDCPVPLFRTARLHVDAAVEMSLSEQR